MVQILKHRDEDIKRVSSLHFLTIVMQTPPPEVWKSTEDDKYNSLPEYKLGHYPPSDADYPYIHISKLGADFFVTQK
jgi:hypothetical protein